MAAARVQHTTDLAHAEARALIARAVDKAEDLAMRGAIAVVGGTGALVSASRMDHGGAGGMARAKSKAWIAATQQIPSTEHLGRLGVIAPPMVAGFTVCSPEAAFPGAGGMPIRRAGAVVAGIAASGAGIGPFAGYPGAVREKLIADGLPANGEDLLVHYALAIPYAGQHGDDVARWVAAHGPFPADAGPGLGMAEPSPATHQHEHAWALALADRVLAEARRRGLSIALALVDAGGDPIQQDRMDGAPAAAVAVSESLARAAATFQCPSRELARRYGTQLSGVLPHPVLGCPGGLPVHEDGRVVAGLGIAGPDPEASEQLAAAVLAAA
jgi:uncharacterized protein GlcG (DUF336 family)